MELDEVLTRKRPREGLEVRPGCLCKDDISRVSWLLPNRIVLFFSDSICSLNF